MFAITVVPGGIGTPPIWSPVCEIPVKSNSF
jgi:hypothetical protein